MASVRFLHFLSRFLSRGFFCFALSSPKAPPLAVCLRVCVCFWCLSMHTHRYTHAADKERSPAQWSSGLKQAQAYPYSIYLSAFPSPCRRRPVPSTLSAVPHHSRPASVTSRPARIEIYTPFVWEAGMLLSDASLCLEEFGWFAFFSVSFCLLPRCQEKSFFFFFFFGFERAFCLVLHGHDIAFRLQI